MANVDVMIRDGVSTYVQASGLRRGANARTEWLGAKEVLCDSAPFHDKDGCLVRFIRPGTTFGRDARNRYARQTAREAREKLRENVQTHGAPRAPRRSAAG